MSTDTLNGNGYAPDELEDDLPPGDGFMVPGVVPDYDGGWNLDLTPTPCPDSIPADYRVDARLWAGNFERRGPHMRLRESRRLVLPSRDAIESYCAALMHGASLEAGERLREAWGEGFDSFAYGAETFPPTLGGSSLTGAFIPLIPGPVTRQLYWQDYFEMSAKAFEAYNHDPLTWRGVQLIGQFALGAGIRSKVTKSSGDGKGQTHEAAQEAWDEFWRVNKMDDRLNKIARDIEIFGEQFIRYFPQPGNPRGLLIRSLDPATIYDIVTDPEDHETVFFYHQQFQTPYQLYAPQGRAPQGGPPAPTGPTQPGAATRYIIRQIDRREVDHYRINVSASERRGRSSLYPVLGWIKRLRDYMTSRVIQADMQARYAYDLEVRGTPGDMAKVQNAMFPGRRPPPPGSVLGHTQSVTLNPIAFQGATSGLGSDQTFEALVNIVAVGLGIPKEYLGIQGKGSRAGSLVATEPGAKRFQSAQELLRLILENIAERFFDAAHFNDAEIEFTFPSIATEERHQKLEDLAFAEGMGWLSKQNSATTAAKELDIESYDFADEQALIAAEFKQAQEDEGDGKDPDPLTGDPGKKPTPKQGDGVIRRPMVLASMRQAPKLDPTRATSEGEDEPPGLLVPFEGSTPPASSNGSGNGKPPAATRGGMPASQNPAASTGATNIKKELKVREDGTIEGMTLDGLAYLMREARGPRRRPDDPEFQKAGEDFRAASARNLGDLVRQAAG